MAKKNRKRKNNSTKGMLGTMSVLSLVLSFIVSVVFLILMAFITLVSISIPSGSPLLAIIDIFGIAVAIYSLVCCSMEILRRNQERASLNQPAPKPEPKPEVKKPEVEVEIPSAYQVYLNQLKQTLESYEERDDEFDQLLEDCFGGSQIAKARYSTVIDQARGLLKENYNRAEQAVELFRYSAVTKERCEILQQYVDDSNEVAISIERVINELAKNRHHSTNEIHDTLNDSLKDLASTTSRYSSNH